LIDLGVDVQVVDGRQATNDTQVADDVVVDNDKRIEVREVHYET